MTCLDLNLYISGVAGAAIVSTIFWFLKYCAAKGALLETLANYGVDNSET